MGLNERANQEVKLSAEVVAVIDAAVQHRFTETVADFPTVDQVNTMIDQRMRDALKTRPTVQDVKNIIDGEIQDLFRSVEEIKKALGEVIQLRETITRIDERLNTWINHRNEMLDEVKDDQTNLAAAHKELSLGIQTISANQRQFRDTVYGDPSAPAGPPSLLARMQTVEGAKLDAAVFERMFIPVLTFVNGQRLEAEAAQAKKEKRQRLVANVKDVLSVKTVSGVGAALGVIVKFFIDNF